MLNPAIGELIEVYDNRYQLVLDVAKQAREIAMEAEKNGEIIVEKPVSLAINRLAAVARGEVPPARFAEPNEVDALELSPEAESDDAVEPLPEEDRLFVEGEAESDTGDDAPQES